MEKEKRTREYGLDMLRIIAMMMIVALHFLGKGGLLADLSKENMPAVGMAAWFLEAFCIVAVNAYMLISGYFICTSEFKINRLIELWLQVLTYSVIVGLLSMVTGVIEETPIDLHYFLSLLFPVSMGHYWFMTAYIFLYLLLPIIVPTVKTISKEKLRLTIILLFSVFCVMKSVLPLRLDMDVKGYDCIWYLCVFLFAAYVRRFGGKLFENKVLGIVLYVLCCVLIFTEAFVLRFVYLRTGSLGLMLGVSYEYNHVLTFAASVGLFILFKNININYKIGKYVSYIAPLTLGVYLLHENLGIRYSWQQWFGANEINSIPMLVARTFIAVLVVFVVGITCDILRKKIFDFAELCIRAVYKKKNSVLK